MRRLITMMLAVVALSGCRGGTSEEPPVLPPPKWLDHYLLPVTNMSLQPKYEAQAQNDFWSDGADMRMPPENTVARGALKADPAFYRGVDANGQPVDQYPVQLTRALLDRGQERYNVYCAPCHDRTGRGQGLVPKRGWVPPPSFFDDRILAFTPGQFYQVISQGVRTMPSYAKQIPEADRWAIVAYIQALQTAATASLDDVPPAQRSNL
jgi:mono/diheme cytochrome c family protein